MLRIIGGVLAGFITMAVIVFAGTLLAATLLLPEGMREMMSPSASAGPLPMSYVAANVLISLVAAIVGGVVATKIGAGHRPRAALVLAGAVLAVGVYSALMPAGAGRQPAWYLWAMPVIGVVGVLIGESMVRPRRTV